MTTTEKRGTHLEDSKTVINTYTSVGWMRIIHYGTKLTIEFTEEPQSKGKLTITLGENFGIRSQSLQAISHHVEFGNGFVEGTFCKSTINLDIRRHPNNEITVAIGNVSFVGKYGRRAIFEPLAVPLAESLFRREGAPA